MKLLSLLFLLISLPVLAQDIETLSWNEARVNDRIPLTLSKADFDKKYKADSIVAPKIGQVCDVKNSENIQMLYYKGVRFELNNGTLSFRSIDFTKRRNMYLSFENDWFDHTTTFKSFAKTYPAASAFIEDYDSEEGEPMDMISILPTSDTDDFEWQFYFQDGRLHFIECFFSCK
jgi:hypothetical protein